MSAMLPTRRSRVFTVLALLVLTSCTGCVTGAIYTRITVPLDVNLEDTPVAYDHDDESVDSIYLDVLRVAWGGNGLAETAKQHGFESIAYADLEILCVLGFWKQEFAVIYGKRKANPGR